VLEPALDERGLLHTSSSESTSGPEPISNTEHSAPECEENGNHHTTSSEYP